MTEQIERVIANGKPLAVIQKLIKEELLRLDRAKFDADMNSEYCLLAYQDVQEEVTSIDEDGNEVISFVTVTRLRDNVGTFEEYKNETKVIQEAVYEDDVLITPELTELVRQYIPLSDEEIELKCKEYLISRYAELRAREYPSILEFADAYVKDDKDGMEAYKQKCLEIKAKYPKELV